MKKDSGNLKFLGGFDPPGGLNVLRGLSLGAKTTKNGAQRPEAQAKLYESKEAKKEGGGGFKPPQQEKRTKNNLGVQTPPRLEWGRVVGTGTGEFFEVWKISQDRTRGEKGANRGQRGGRNCRQCRSK